MIKFWSKKLLITIIITIIKNFIIAILWFNILFQWLRYIKFFKSTLINLIIDNAILKSLIKNSISDKLILMFFVTLKNLLLYYYFLLKILSFILYIYSPFFIHLFIRYIISNYIIYFTKSLNLQNLYWSAYWKYLLYWMLKFIIDRF